MPYDIKSYLRQLLTKDPNFPLKKVFDAHDRVNKGQRDICYRADGSSYINGNINDRSNNNKNKNNDDDISSSSGSDNNNYGNYDDNDNDSNNDNDNDDSNDNDDNNASINIRNGNSITTVTHTGTKKKGVSTDKTGWRHIVPAPRRSSGSNSENKSGSKTTVTKTKPII